MATEIHLLSSPRWKDYELLDSGDGLKLERFGPYTFVRPEVQALWKRSLAASAWDSAHALFQPSGEESGGHWAFKKKVPEQWEMKYTLSLSASSQAGTSPDENDQELQFSVMTTPGRHLGVFPECASNWDWTRELIFNRERASSPPEKPLNILNLFGYTGLATLACAAAGAKVTHVDASRKSVSWAHTNQDLSGLSGKPVRWVVDDALKFAEREARRGVKYDGILLDPPKFGRGPKGEIWEIYKSLPQLLHACQALLSDHPLFVVLTVYAVKLPAIHANFALAEMMKDYGGDIECGELVTEEKSAGRLLSQAVYARWRS
ncbi:MAG TPA: class I SAM-dependent methyltransferase [Anaerolineales bacterium]